MVLKLQVLSYITYLPYDPIPCGSNFRFFAFTQWAILLKCSQAVIFTSKESSHVSFLIFLPLQFVNLNYHYCFICRETPAQNYVCFESDCYCTSNVSLTKF